MESVHFYAPVTISKQRRMGFALAQPPSIQLHGYRRVHESVAHRRGVLEQFECPFWWQQPVLGPEFHAEFHGIFAFATWIKP